MAKSARRQMADRHGCVHVWRSANAPALALFAVRTYNSPSLTLLAGACHAPDWFR